MDHHRCRKRRVVLSGNRLRRTPTTANTIVNFPRPAGSFQSAAAEVYISAKPIMRKSAKLRRLSAAQKSAESIDGSILAAFVIVAMHGREPHRSSPRCRSVPSTHMKTNRTITNHHQYDVAYWRSGDPEISASEDFFFFDFALYKCSPVSYTHLTLPTNREV